MALSRLPAVRCRIPIGFSDFHPCYLPPTTRHRIHRSFNRRGIFLNIPYAERYTALEVAIISTATAYGLRPVMAKQRVVFEERFRRIWTMILGCPYAFTDLSYVRRMNMPLELGLILALGKNCFITSDRRYQALRSISDLNLGDIHYHQRRPRRLIADFSAWIEANCTRVRIPLRFLIARFRAVSWLRLEHLGIDEFDRLDPMNISDVLDAATTKLGITFGD